MTDAVAAEIVSVLEGQRVIAGALHQQLELAGGLLEAQCLGRRSNAPQIGGTVPPRSRQFEEQARLKQH